MFRHNSTRVPIEFLTDLPIRDYAKSFGISKLGKTYAVPSLRGDLVELKNDMDICNVALFMHDGDTIDIYVCDDTILEDVGPTEGQINQFLSQVVESFNAHEESDGSLTAQPKKTRSMEKRGRDQYERASNNNTGTRRGARSGYKKRPKVVGQGVFVADTGYTCINQGLSSSRRVNTGVVSYAHVTCDIGFKPSKELKWKGKQATTQRELQVQSVMRRIQTRSKVVGIQTTAQANGKSPSKKIS
ncbi:hypothetical protein H5410_042060 [Solanum commersonii]|uniref:Transposon MuDR mudrA n=1 Tax=Solanum commersonii TaxID=4109 RepID=A0A9J5XUW6_SOLCO|nr:hypothetical protein H5410_042060 [Solanum commersonii]